MTEMYMHVDCNFGLGADTGTDAYAVCVLSTLGIHGMGARGVCILGRCG